MYILQRKKISFFYNGTNFASNMLDNSRTFNDTQIYKEYRNGKCEISKDEWLKIQSAARTGIWADGYRYNNDKANGYFAFSFGKADQRENPEWGEELVDALNQICESWGEEADWYLGDATDEYVFVD